MKKLLTSPRFWLLFTVALLGAVLWKSSVYNYVEAPRFSHESGFYDTSFTLGISAFNAEKIYYTLDGSTPSEDSLIYTGPIKITNATQNPNHYSARDDVAVYFSDEYLKRIVNTNYKIPDFPVDKCTIIRAIAVSPGGMKSEVSSASYFAEQQPEDYGCNVLSLITDPANLFDSTTGIYVTGDIYNRYVASPQIEGQHYANWQANYQQRGRDWERPAILQFFDHTGAQIYTQNVGVRVHGNFSRALLPRSLKFYARLEYDNSNTFNQKLFSSDYLPQTVILSSGGNQVITLIADVLMTEMVRDLNFSTQLFSPYVLFINGEYWGFYWLAEKYDEAYISHYYDVQADNVVMIKDAQPETGDPADKLLFQNMVTFIAENDMSVNDNYQAACDLIDMDSFLDYYATMIYICRTLDWPGTNTALWRTRDVSPSSTYSDGKWRWMLFDCNSPCMRDDANMTEADSLTYVIETDPLFQSLWKNDTFREQFEQRILNIGQTCFAPQKVNAFIDAYTEKMKPILRKSWARFRGSENTAETDYDEMISSHKLFFEGRLPVVQSWFK